MKKADKIILTALSALYVLPVAITIVRSFVENGSFTLSRYYELFVYNYPYFSYYGNSVLYAVTSSVLCITISLPLGLLFAKIRFRFRDTIFTLFIIIMMMPFQATMLPDYIVLRDLGLLNTRAAFILPAVFSPLAVFLLRQFIKAIPDEQLDAAVLETTSPTIVILRIVLPQIKPAILTLFILLFCESYNMLEQAFVFSPQNSEIYPLSAMLKYIPDEVGFPSATVYMFPVIVLFLLFEKTVYSGMERYKL